MSSLRQMQSSQLQTHPLLAAVLAPHLLTYNSLCKTFIKPMNPNIANTQMEVGPQIGPNLGSWLVYRTLPEGKSCLKLDSGNRRTTGTADSCSYGRVWGSWSELRNNQFANADSVTLHLDCCENHAAPLSIFAAARRHLSQVWHRLCMSF